MSEAVTVPNWMMMTLIVSEESLARDIHTCARTRVCTHAHRDMGSSVVNFSNSLWTLNTHKKPRRSKDRQRMPHRKASTDVYSSQPGY